MNANVKKTLREIINLQLDDAKFRKKLLRQKLAEVNNNMELTNSDVDEFNAINHINIIKYSKKKYIEKLELEKEIYLLDNEMRFMKYQLIILE